ncbi:MAG TPA: xanthine dehydrogenase family protein molybdopterin-binding subunit [Burkholderiales bacterium]|nr:xanthine dehydrogenase family protein molybdopterin-binding subunit [Burkholderiales bacterium]
MRTANEGRRRFLQAGAALMVGFYLPARAQSIPGKTVGPAAAVGDLAPNAFVRIGADNTVTVIAKHVEMGQGTYTGLATLVAEELDADWTQVRVEGAPADAKVYNNLQWGPMQGTGGSTAIANSYEQLRKAGAAARAMLVAAAAETWKVPANEIVVRDGTLTHRSGRNATFGALAEKASAMKVPAEVKLKDPKDFRLIGKHIPRQDSRAKTNGTAQFTIDVKRPNMLTAVVAHAPVFGSKVKSFDASKAKAVRGVVDVVQIPTGVAVLATNFWSAKKGRDALSVQWDGTGVLKLGSAELMAQYKALATRPGAVAKNEGDADKAFAGAAKTLEAAYEFPYLAHSAMEPMNCVVERTEDGCEVWNGEQFHTVDQMNVAKVFGLEPEQVKINMLYAGGSFGRRASSHSDYLVETAEIVKAIGGKAPVKLQWTREDDTHAGYFRPMYFHTIRAGLDASGKLVAWQHRIVGQSILAGTPMEKMLVKGGVDATSVEGASNLPYQIPNLRVDLHTTRTSVPVLWWRSVGSTHTAYSTETMIDELAVAAGQDPVAFRRAMLGQHPRHRGVLDLAAEKAGWGEPLPEGRGRGIAVHESFHSYVAQVAEITMLDDKRYRVDRVVCAVDCGVAVNPDVIRAQMEGGIGFGLSAALHGAITLKDGRIEQSNFHDYKPLRIGEMPRVEVYIVPSTEKPTGVGEPGVPPIAPAVANAIAAATGKRLRNLPLVLT